MVEIMIAIAAAMKADVCEIYTDVKGIYTADPGICANARKINRISYVVNTIGRFARTGIGLITIPHRIRRRDVVQTSNHSSYDIVNVGKVPTVVAIVENVNGFASKNVFGELK